MQVLVSILIIVISLMLFLYWFRYTCVLILSTRASRDYATHIASANQLTFLEARDRLMMDTATGFGNLHRSLDRDYRLLVYLLRHAANYNVKPQKIEHRVLMADYLMMRMWFFVTRKVSHSQARGALLEMTAILNHLANAMGERVSVASRL